ncbi:prothoracicostatic peptide [Toxorhynchites rutilus septentrionalis]|uniref:prothoracicostatic peptide n=1 Tax=Toxorhynchites rutilus septentrionalis TaxID=329112 RepID=UPI002479FA39|nr:prothoracicostatic peptide [Toxorhynchites rutilus septentrionalis]XP_055615634.1 prothoracicostatic peptide [Toxorhynchites rutilus septentrionalis]
MINETSLQHSCATFIKILLLVLLCTVVRHSQADETPTEQQQIEHADDVMQHNLQKRTWKSLQGGWGKRASDEQQRESDVDYEGYRNRDETATDYSGGHELDKLDNFLIRSMIDQRLEQTDTQYDGTDDELPMDKRAWNKMNGGWGKRVNAGPGQWNKFRGAWGKREPGWNNLKGLWGKRSEKWNKLASSWGKRDNSNSNNY